MMHLWYLPVLVALGYALRKLLRIGKQLLASFILTPMPPDVGVPGSL